MIKSSTTKTKQKSSPQNQINLMHMLYLECQGYQGFSFGILTHYKLPPEKILSGSEM